MNGVLTTPPRLKLLRHEPEPVTPSRVETGDLLLLGTLLLVGLVPLVGELAGGEWGGGTLGAAAALACLSGRELLTQLGALVRARP